MKRIYRTVSALLTAALLMTMLLTGCGETSSSSIKDDAENYVKAVLDLMCTGTYDHSVTFGDVASGREQESRDEMIAGIVSSIAKDNDLNEEQRARLEDCLTRAFSACRYTIKDVRESEDGGCDVTVSIEPLKVFEGISDALNSKVRELTGDGEAMIAMTPEEQTAALAEVLLSQLDQNLENPQYGPAEEVIVHYGLLQGSEDRYGIDENAGKTLGEKLFSSEGL
jgi:hypothetical protein